PPTGPSYEPRHDRLASRGPGPERRRPDRPPHGRGAALPALPAYDQAAQATPVSQNRARRVDGGGAQFAQGRPQAGDPKAASKSGVSDPVDLDHGLVALAAFAAHQERQRDEHRDDD